MSSSHEINMLAGIQEQAAITLASRAFMAIEEKHGPDSNNPKEYHNLTHSRDDVTASLIELADRAISNGRITAKDKALLIIAGAYHDIEQDLGSGANEAASSRWACADMRQAGMFTAQEESVVDSVIMATVVCFENGVIRQSVPPGNFLAELIADADLSSLGRPTDIYWDRVLRLRTELFGDNMSIDEQITFLQDQVKLLTHHQYYSQEARELFPHQDANLASTQAALDALTK